MKRTTIATVSVIGLALLLAGCGGLFTSPVPKEPVALHPGEPTLALIPISPRLLGESMIQGEYVPDRLVVAIEDGPQRETALQTVRNLVGDRIIDTVILDDVVLALIDLKADVDVPEALGTVVLLAVGRLPGQKQVEGILFAEPDYVFRLPDPVPPPVDVKGTLQPAVYDPYADLRKYQWALDAINADAAWAMGYTGNGVIVAVIDTGVDSTHPDLTGQVIAHCDPQTVPPTVFAPGLNFDTHGHGSHVSGIIAAKSDGRGIVGLAYNAKILDVRIFVPGFIGLLPTARGIKWAVDQGAHILNNSWGGTAYSQVLKAAFDYALSRGVVVVASAGNSYNTIWFRPASIAGVIAVGASTPHNTKVDFSTMGTWLSVSAPGVRVLSCVHTGPAYVQPGTGRPLLYDYWDGTSMAGPYVAALAALILERHPTATPYQVKKLIETTAKDLEAPGFDIRTGYGLIQADRALTAPLPPDNGAALRVQVTTASFGVPVPFMDIVLRKDGRIIERGQTDLEGWFYIGFPTEEALGLFPVLDPGTYEVIVGGEDATYYYSPPAYPGARTANRVTARGTVTLTAGGTATLNLTVNTTLTVTLTWTEPVDLDLAVWEWDPYKGSYQWSTPKTGALWGTFSGDVTGGGSETYTLAFPHWGYDVYYLAIDATNATDASTTALVTIVQNGVTEIYGPYTVGAGAFYPSTTPWPGWWDIWRGPVVY